MAEEKNKGTSRNASEKQLKDLQFVKELQRYVYAVQWSQKRLTLKEFADTFQEPQLVKIVRGQHQTLGYPDPTLNPLMFAWSRRVRSKILAQSLKSMFSMMCPVGPRFEIPDDSRFEFLSESGDSLIRIDRVSELSHHYSKTFMVKERIHAHLRRLEEGREEVRPLKIGEVIKVGAVLPPCKEDIAPPCGCRRLLECETSEGEKVFVSMETAGRFSKMGEDIAEVQTVSSVSWFPMDVKLVEPLPVGMTSPYVRLISKAVEEVLMVLPLCKDARVLEVPTAVPMEVLVPVNLEELSRIDMHACLQRRIEELLQKKIETTQNDRASQPPQSSEPSDTHLPQPSISSEPPPDETGGDTSPDPYDEIDEVYADMRRIAAERCHIPMEKETSL